MRNALTVSVYRNDIHKLNELLTVWAVGDDYRYEGNMSYAVRRAIDECHKVYVVGPNEEAVYHSQQERQASNEN